MKKTKTHKDVNIINCTPHDIVFIAKNHIDDEFYAIEKFIIEKSGIIPRLIESQEKVDTFKTEVIREYENEKGWNLYIDIMKKSFNEVEGLPEPQENTYYIVSALVAGACKNRDDLVVPNDIVRDEKGNIIGCRSLAKI